MRIVCDTNVWLSALTSKQGASFQLVRWLFAQSNVKPCISTPFIMELEDVLMRPENRARMPQFSQAEIKQFIDDICHISIHQPIYFLWRPLIKDQKDDMVLELTVNAQADFLITYNLKDFRSVASKFSFELMTPKTFIQQQGVIR